MMRTIHLHGALAERFGTQHRFVVDNPAEGVRALCSQLPGFDEALREGEYRCVIGRHKGKGRVLGSPDGRNPEAAGDLRLPWRKGETDFHLVPAVSGRKNAGTKIIIGVLIIAVAFAAPWATGAFAAATATTAAGAGMATTAFSLGAGLSVSWGQIAFMGALVALGGVAMAISPQPKATGPRESADQQPSFLFNGPVNTVEQGGPVPLVYGEIITGSQVVGMDLRSDAPGPVLPEKAHYIFQT